MQIQYYKMLYTALGCGRAKSTDVTTARARVNARASLRMFNEVLSRVSTVIEFRPLFAVSHTVPYTSDLCILTCF